MFLHYAAFQKACFAIHQTKKHLGALHFLHIHGFSCKKWANMHQKRLAQGVPWCYQELEEVAHIPLCKLLNARDKIHAHLSSFVKENIPLLQQAAHQCDQQHIVPVSDLVSKEVLRIPGYP